MANEKQGNKEKLVTEGQCYEGRGFCAIRIGDLSRLPVAMENLNGQIKVLSEQLKNQAGLTWIKILKWIIAILIAAYGVMYWAGGIDKRVNIMERDIKMLTGRIFNLDGQVEK